MEFFTNILITCACGFLCYNAGKYQSLAKIYERALEEYIRCHFEENFQDDIKLKTKENEDEQRN